MKVICCALASASFFVVSGAAAQAVAQPAAMAATPIAAG